MDVVIERIRDAQEIVAILRLFDGSFPRSISSRVGDLDLHAQKLAEHACVHVAKRDDRTVGFTAFYANDAASATAFLSHLAVDSALRGQGIGQMLLRDCLQAARQAGMKRLRLEVDTDNAQAIRFYTAQGFSVLGTASAASCFMQRDGL